MGVTTQNTERLEKMLSPHRQSMDVLQEALKEVSKEQADKRKEAAKDLIRKSLELQTRMDAAERTFKQEKAKFDKELGKLVRRLENMVAGRAADEGEEDSEQSSQNG